MITNLEVRFLHGVSRYVPGEDDPDARSLLCALLVSEGFQGQAAATGLDRLVAAKQLNPVLSTVALGLPDLDGHEVARRIRKETLAPLVIITAFSKPDDEPKPWPQMPLSIWQSPSAKGAAENYRRAPAADTRGHHVKASHIGSRGSSHRYDALGIAAFSKDQVPDPVHE
jgi:CheY-like chemotaxis protein